MIQRAVINFGQWPRIQGYVQGNEDTLLKRKLNARRVLEINVTVVQVPHFQEVLLPHGGGYLKICN